MLNKETIIECAGLRFLIMDAPTRTNATEYVDRLLSYGVTDLVRTCEPMYDSNVFEHAGITCHDLHFVDGSAPPSGILTRWLSLVKQTFPSVKRNRENEGTAKCIAVHCLAGLGRAPLLVSIALIEAGLEYLEAAEFLRTKRPGVLNAQQLTYLKSYRKRGVYEAKSCCEVS